MLKNLRSHLHYGHKHFTIKEGVEIPESVSCMASMTQCGLCLTIPLQHSICKDLKISTQCVLFSPKFHKLTSISVSENYAITIFFKSKAIKEVWNVKKKFRMSKTLQEELALFLHVIKNANTFKWEILIWHLIDRDYECTVIGDSCLTRGDTF